MIEAGMQVIRYSERDSSRWDEFLADAPMATLLHTRRFLSYHGERFQDVSAIIEEVERGVVGVFPAAIDPTDPRRVVSHPGATFGGLVHAGRLAGERMIEALELLRRHYAGLGFESLRYKAVPHIYQQTPAQDDLYALFRAGAVRHRCDLSCAVELAGRAQPSSRRRRGLRKANNAGVQIEESAEHVSQLWTVLEQHLAEKYDAKPVHSLAEITLLHSLFPDTVRFVVARHEGEVIAGVVLLAGPRVTRLQYAASNQVGYTLSALDAVFDYCLENAAQRGSKYFDFGTSNENEGQYLNAGLYQFKQEFGGGGVAYESYELELTG